MISNVKVREAVPEDVSALLDLIRELAVYENEPDEVEVTKETLLNDGFGGAKVFDAFVATFEGQVIGMALYYTGYSTWKGKTLYLEDFLVTSNYRRMGIGELLFDAVVAKAKELNVRRMDWQVLDWNEPAINFYKKKQAVLDGEWLNGRLFFDQKK